MAEDFKTSEVKSISREDWEKVAAEIAYLRQVEQNRQTAEEKKRQNDESADFIMAEAIYAEVKFYLNFMAVLAKIRDDAHLFHEQIALKNFETQKFQERCDDYLQQFQKTAAQQSQLTPAALQTELTRLDTLITAAQEKNIAEWGSTDWQTGLNQQAEKLVEKIGNPFSQVPMPDNLDAKTKASMQTAAANMQAQLREQFSHRKPPEQIQKIIVASHTAAMAPVVSGEQAPMAPPLTMNFTQSARQFATKAITDTELLVATGARDLYRKFGDIVNPHGSQQFIRMGANFAKGAVGAIKEFHHKVDNFCENNIIINNLSQAKDQLQGLVSNLEKSLHHTQTARPSLRR